MEGRYKFALTGKELVGFITLALAIGPIVFFTGRASADLSGVKSYIAGHEAEAKVYRATIIEDHRVLADLSANTERLARTQGEILTILARLDAQLQELRGRPSQ